MSAKDVKVAKYCRAECQLCEWTGQYRNSYQDANEERLQHLEEHADGRRRP